MLVNLTSVLEIFWYFGINFPSVVGIVGVMIYLAIQLTERFHEMIGVVDHIIDLILFNHSDSLVQKQQVINAHV